jgi:hypothetical protein
MAAIVAGGVVLLSLIAGGAFAYFIFKAYKKHRRTPLVDEEQARNLEHTARDLQQDTTLQDVERPEGPYPSGQWYGSPGIVPANVAPVALPLPTSHAVEYTGGEGLVSPLERVFRSEEAANGKGKERVFENDQFQHQMFKANRSYDLQGFEPGYTTMHHEQPEILSPKPMRAVTPKANATLKDTIYDEKQEKVSGHRDDIENRTNIDTGRIPKHKLSKQHTMPATNIVRGPTKADEADFEVVVDLNSANVWARNEQPATPFTGNTLKIRESFDSSTTFSVANNLNAERPLEHVVSKQNTEPEITMPKSAFVDRAADTKRRVEEAKRKRAEKKRLKKEEEAEQRREAEQQKEHEAEQQRAANEEKRRVKKERAHTLAQMTGTDIPKRRVWKDDSAQQSGAVKNYGKYAFASFSDSGPEKSLRR